MTWVTRLLNPCLRTMPARHELLMVGGLLSAFAILLTTVALAAPTSFDRWLGGTIQSFPWGELSFLPRFGSDLGGGVYGFYVAPIAAAGVFAAFRQWKLILLLLIVFALHYVMTSPKIFLPADRPSPVFGVDGAGGLESFPSGHVQWAVSFYGFLAYLGWQVLPERYRLAVIPAYALVVMGTMLGRIELGRHWPIDTVGGVLVGLVALRIVMALHLWPQPRSPRPTLFTRSGEGPSPQRGGEVGGAARPVLAENGQRSRAQSTGG